jgi:YHS domain-containing protein
MKNRILFPFLGLLLTVLFSCTSKPKPEHLESPVTAESEKGAVDIDVKLLASTKDTICGMDVSDAVNDTLNVDSKIYGFCSTGCKESFASQLAAVK